MADTYGTVGELIEFLSQFPEDAAVKVAVYDRSGHSDVYYDPLSDVSMEHGTVILS